MSHLSGSFARVVLLSLTLSQLSFAQWNWVNPLPQGNDLTDIWVFDQSNSVVVGEGGTILKTSDGGKNWSVRYEALGIKANLNSLYFINDYKGWAVGGKYVLKTDDSGESWEIQYAAGSTDLRGVFFRDAANGMAVGTKGVVLKTHDGGINWEAVTLDTNVDLYSVDFFDAKDGVVAGIHQNGGIDSVYSIVYATHDSGENWSERRQIHSRTAGQYFLNAGTGWIFGDSLCKTTNGGQTWVNQGYGAIGVISLYFLDESNGWSILERESDEIPGLPYYYCSLSRTSDGGLNWQEVRSLRFNFKQKLRFLGRDTAYIVGGNGNILRTTDGGDTWDHPARNFDVNNFVSVCFPTPAVGYVVSDVTKIVKTTDGGKSWGLLPGTPQAAITASDFVDKNHGLIGTNGGNLYKTTDGGESWGEIDLYSQSLCTYVYSISFIDTNVAFISGYPFLLRTTDGGASWEKNDRIAFPFLVVFIDSSLGYLTDVPGSLYKTMDQGKSWFDISGSMPGLIKSIDFNNKQTGFVICKDGSVVFTRNGGTSWNVAEFPDGFQLASMCFIDSLAGYAVGTGGMILYTEDGGKRWAQQESPTTNDLSSVSFLDKSNGFIAGSNGVLLSTSTGGFVAIHNRHNDRSPEGYHLFQNFPNPFNPTTAISYELSAGSRVTLKVYDVLGREVATLVDGHQNAGVYKVNFNASRYASGVYFYRLAAIGNDGRRFVSIKEAVLLK